MVSLRTEEEQVAVLKRLWNNYGSALIVGVILSLLVVFGWRMWKEHAQEQAYKASALYQQILDISRKNAAQPLQGEEAARFDELFSSLKNEFDTSVQSHLAALLKAGQAVNGGNLAEARSCLEWILERSPGREIATVTRMRLARVLMEQSPQDSAEDALNLLHEIEQPGAFKASYEELRGDILLSLGRHDQAREAYQLAVDLGYEKNTVLPLAKLKLNDLGHSVESDN